jgi:3-oxoacyl-(acyl-carrier-protein) synthase
MHLKQDEAGMSKMTLLDSIHKETLPVAEVKLSNEQLSSISGLPTKITRTALLSLVAAKEAMNDAGIITKGLRTVLSPPTLLVVWIKQKIFILNFVQTKMLVSYAML